MDERSIGRRAAVATLGVALAGCGGSRPADEETTGGGATTGGEATTTATNSAQPTATPEDITLPEGEGWPAFGGTTGNRGAMDTGPGPSTPAAAAWRVDVDGTYTMPGPAVVNGRTFVGSGTKAYAFDAITGDDAWEADLEVLTHHFSPAVVGDTVVFGAQPSGTIQPGSQGRLAAFGFDGTERWRRKLPITTDPTVTADGIFFGESATDGGAVRRVGLDGTDDWRVELPVAGVRGAPALIDDLLVVTAATDDAGSLIGLDPASGDRRFSVRLASGARAAPVLTDDRILVQRNDGVLVAFDRDGSRRWKLAAADRAGSTPVVTDDRIVALVENRLVGIDPDGTVVWDTDIGTTLINGVTVSRDTAYVGGSKLSAVDTADGSQLWDVPIPGQSGAFGAPVVVGNTAFVGVCIKREAGDLYDDYMYAFV